MTHARTVSILAAAFFSASCAALQFKPPTDAEAAPRVVKGSFNRLTGLVNLTLGEWTVPNSMDSSVGMTLNFLATTLAKSDTTYTFTVHRKGAPVATLKCDVRTKDLGMYSGMFAITRPNRVMDCQAPGFSFLLLERTDAEYLGQVTMGAVRLEAMSETVRSGSVQRPMAAITFRREGYWAGSVSQEGTGYFHTAMPPEDEVAATWAALAFGVARPALEFRR